MFVSWVLWIAVLTQNKDVLFLRAHEYNTKSECEAKISYYVDDYKSRLSLPFVVGKCKEEDQDSGDGRIGRGPSTMWGE